MKFTKKVLIIPAFCLLTGSTPVCAQTSSKIAPSATYLPEASEFSPSYSGIISEISSSIATKDKAQLLNLVSRLSEREESNSTRGDDDEKYFLSGFLKRSAGDLHGAVEDFKKSIEFRQSNPHAHFLLAQSLADLDRCQEVFSELDQVRFTTGSEPAAGYLLRAQCLAKLNRQPEAESIIALGRKAYSADSQIKKLSLMFKANAMSSGAILTDAQMTELDGDLAELAVANPEDLNIQLMYGKSLLKKGDILTKSIELDTAEKIAQTLVDKSVYRDEASIKLLFDVFLKKRLSNKAQDVLNRGKLELPESKVIANCQKQLKIEVEGLKVLKYDRR